MSGNAPIWHRHGDCAHDDSWDALTTFGVRLWRPDVQSWREVSVRGQAFGPRPHTSSVGEQILPSRCARGSGPFQYEAMNELVDGCIIDIAGVCLLFQSPRSMHRQLEVDPLTLLRRLNAVKPQCPVHMHTIKFSHSSSKERVGRVLKGMSSSGEGLVATGSFFVPPVDYWDTEEDRRPYVFPACGHVHAYSKALEGK